MGSERVGIERRADSSWTSEEECSEGPEFKYGELLAICLRAEGGGTGELLDFRK